MNPESFELTLEQQFYLKSLESSCEGASKEQLTKLVIDASRLIMLKDNAIKNMLKDGFMPTYLL